MKENNTSDNFDRYLDDLNTYSMKSSAYFLFSTLSSAGALGCAITSEYTTYDLNGTIRILCAVLACASISNSVCSIANIINYFKTQEKLKKYIDDSMKDFIKDTESKLYR